jgi:hypothetical protein
MMFGWNIMLVEREHQMTKYRYLHVLQQLIQCVSLNLHIENHC